MTHRIQDLCVYLCVDDMDRAMAFYARAFGAREHYRLTGPESRVGHAEMHLGDNVVMLAEAFPEMGVVAPDPTAPASVSFYLHVDNADALIEDAVAAGAALERSPTDQFHGERIGVLRDPFGYRWLIGHSIEDVGVEEMQRRYDALFRSQA